MNYKNKKYPFLRFKNFNDEWEQCKLIDNAKEILDYRGKSPEKFGMNWTDEGYLVLSSLNVKDGYIDKNIEAKYADQSLFEYWMKDNKLEKGDVLFTTEAPLGNVAQIPDNEGYVLNQRVVAFKTDNTKTNNNFLANLLKSPLVQSKLNAKSTGGTAKGIGMKEFSKISSLIPIEVSEQSKIGNLFYSLDHLITLHQSKLENLEQTKKGLLQKLFPKINKVIPKIRFNSFFDNWLKFKLAELSNITIGEFVIKSKQNTPSSIYSVYNGGVSYTGKYELYNNEGPKIIISARGANAGFINLIKTRYWAGNSCYSIDILNDDEFYIDFIYYFMKRHQYLFTNYQQKASIPAISKYEVQNFEIISPSAKEQIQIGNLFSSLDHLITLHQNELKNLEIIKKGLLQKMFV